MADTDPLLSTAPVAGIAEPHQSTVATILRAHRMGLFTAAQAELLIDRVRAYLTASPVEFRSSVVDGFSTTVGAHSPDTLLDSPDRTVS